MHKHFIKSGLIRVVLMTMTLTTLTGCSSFADFTKNNVYYDTEDERLRVKYEASDNPFVPRTSGRINEKGEFRVKAKWEKQEFWDEFGRLFNMSIDRWFGRDPVIFPMRQSHQSSPGLTDSNSYIQTIIIKPNSEALQLPQVLTQSH